MTASLPRVRLLLSTHNGAPYLRAQIDSLRAQTHTNWELWARDDGSSDESPEILRQLASEDARIRVWPGNTTGSGAAAAFGALLHEAQDAPYLGFCDQDDVWEPYKLELTLRALVEAEHAFGATTPLLVHTDLALVDANLKPLASSAKAALHMRANDPHPLPRLLAQNIVTGCTMLFNGALARAALPIPPEALMHDWWLALVAAAQGHIRYLPQATLRYRQHGHNVSGPARVKGWREGISKFLESEAALETLVRRRLAQTRVLATRLRASPTPPPAARFLDDFVAHLDSNRLGAAVYGLSRGIRAQRLPGTFAYYLLLLRGVE